MTSSSMTRITRGPSSRSRQACLRVTIDHPGQDPAGIGYPELLCAGVARLMLRDGVGCTPGSPAPRWMPRIHWVEAHAEEIEAVGALVLECLDVANEGGDPPGRDDSVVTQGLRRTRAAFLEAQRADPWCQRLCRWFPGVLQSGDRCETWGCNPLNWRNCVAGRRSSSWRRMSAA